MEDEKKQGLESLFVTYEQGLALKELGFDEDCFAFHSTIYGLVIGGASGNSVLYESAGECLAPLKQQVFRWFRDKHRLSQNTCDWIDDFEFIIFEWTLSEDRLVHTFELRFDTYEEAESECINKLIEIIKNK